jgi:hypothetical protein
LFWSQFLDKIMVNLTKRTSGRVWDQARHSCRRLSSAMVRHPGWWLVLLSGSAVVLGWRRPSLVVVRHSWVARTALLGGGRWQRQSSLVAWAALLGRGWSEETAAFTRWFSEEKARWCVGKWKFGVALLFYIGYDDYDCRLTWTWGSDKGPSLLVDWEYNHHCWFGWTRQWLRVDKFILGQKISKHYPKLFKSLIWWCQNAMMYMFQSLNWVMWNYVRSVHMLWKMCRPPFKIIWNFFGIHMNPKCAFMINNFISFNFK